MNSDHTIKAEDIETNVKISLDYRIFIDHLAKEFSYDSLNSPIGCKDLIEATMRAHAALNKRSYVCVDDLIFIKRMQPYLKNPFSPYDGKIVRLRAQGLSIRKICKDIGKGNYEQRVQRVIKKAELRGTLSPSE
jgi:hypothetical protein